jgi:hypothetical protein
MDRSQNYRRFGNKFNICLYTVTGILLLTLACSTRSKAQQAPSNTNIAGPSASATGNVTNQAVQVLQGPYAMNTFGSGVSCQGPTMSVSPFILGNTNASQDPQSFQTYSGNAGISLGFNFPLDGSLQELCKSRARVEITRQQAEADKARLDFELVRLLKCGEAIKSGITFHPDSPYAKICADIVVRYPRVQDVTNGNKTNTNKK